MKNFKKNVESFLDKNNIRYAKGTPERLYQDLHKLKSQLKVKSEPGNDKYRTARYGLGPPKRQLELF